MSNSAGVRGVVLGLGRLCRPITAIAANSSGIFSYRCNHWRRNRGGGGGGKGACALPFQRGGGKVMFVPPPLSDTEFRPRHRAY